MITINLIKRVGDSVVLDVNNKKVTLFKDTILYELSDETLMHKEKKAAIWFATSSLRIQSSILY